MGVVESAPWHIQDLAPSDPTACQEAAALLVEGFRRLSPAAWPDLEAGRAEVDDCLEPGRICRMAAEPGGRLLGWIGGRPQYAGRVWELHPLVVRAACRGRGVGQALVADLEVGVRARGGLTLWAGADDEAGLTSLAGQDLYPDVLGRLAAIRNPGCHRYEFYLKAGFSLVGVMPDANGPGKPDIYLAKRLTSPP